MENKHKMTMRIPRALHRRAKAKAALMGTTLSAVVRKLLEKWIEEPLPEEVKQEEVH